MTEPTLPEFYQYRVVHCKRNAYDIYCGRRRNTAYHFGNPFTIGQDGNRAEVISKFLYWLDGYAYHDVEPERRQWILQSLHLLRGKRLGCWCAPKDCHCRILVDKAEGSIK